MFCGNAFVPEIAIDLIHFRETTDQQAFQIKFGSDAKIKIGIERFVMGHKRTRPRAAGNRLHHGRFHFGKSFSIEETANPLDDFASFAKNILHFVVHDQIQIPMAIPGFHIFQAVPFFRKHPDNFGKKCEAFDFNCFLAFVRQEKRAFDSQNIAQIKLFKKMEFFFSQHIKLGVNLNFPGFIFQIRESTFPVNPARHHAAGCFHSLPFLERFQNAANGMSRPELILIQMGPLRLEGFNFLKALF